MRISTAGAIKAEVSAAVRPGPDLMKFYACHVASNEVEKWEVATLAHHQPRIHS